MKRRPIPAWIWVEGHGWLEGAIDPDNVYFATEPPDGVSPQTRIVAVERGAHEEPPNEIETVLILADAQAMEDTVRGNPPIGLWN